MPLAPPPPKKPRSSPADRSSPGPSAVVSPSLFYVLTALTFVAINSAWLFVAFGWPWLPYLMSATILGLAVIGAISGAIMQRGRHEHIPRG